MIIQTGEPKNEEPHTTHSDSIAATHFVDTSSNISTVGRQQKMDHISNLSGLREPILEEFIAEVIVVILFILYILTDTLFKNCGDKGSITVLVSIASVMRKTKVLRLTEQ